MEETRQFPMWLRLLMALSGTAYAVELIQTNSFLSLLITAVLALVLLVVLTVRTSFLNHLFTAHSIPTCITAGVLAVLAVYTAKSTFYSTCQSGMHKLVSFMGLPHGDLIVRLVPWAVALVALPMVFGYLLWFTSQMGVLARRLWQESDFTEQMFFLGAGLVFAIMIVLTYLCTQAFVGAHLGGQWFNFDIIYSADSGYLVNQDVYRNVGAGQNDLRQPLFGVFAMPFAQCAWLLSKILFFLPAGYLTIWQIMQMLLYLIAAVLLSRMMNLHGAEKGMFLAMLCLSFPVLIFSLTAEQYLMAVFYLIFLLYLQHDPVNQSLGYIAATGSLLTSGIWFPLVSWDRDFRKFVKKTFMLCGAFLAVLILSGRLTTILDIPSYIAGYVPYAGGGVPLLQKLMQYVNFAGACVLAPNSGADTTSYAHISWQMLPVTGWSPVGIVVIVLSIGGILVSRRERFTKICAVWLGFSFLLLGIVGWGTVDNGLMLYSLYFGWAFVAMIFRLISWALGKYQSAKLAVILVLIVGIGIYNILALQDVLVFATEYFPTLGGAL